MMERLMHILKFLWRSVAALVAVVLIIAAFMVGWSLRGAPPPPDEAGDEAAQAEEPPARASARSS